VVKCWDSAVGTLLLGHLYVGLNSLWAPSVTVIVQLMCCLVLCSVVALLASIKLFIFATARFTCICTALITLLTSYNNNKAPPGFMEDCQYTTAKGCIPALASYLIPSDLIA
jgi:hypothetical protein